jgi:hypothetical protein
LKSHKPKAKTVARKEKLDLPQQPAPKHDKIQKKNKKKLTSHS